MNDFHSLLNHVNSEQQLTTTRLVEPHSQPQSHTDHLNGTISREDIRRAVNQGKTHKALCDDAIPIETRFNDNAKDSLYEMVNQCFDNMINNVIWKWCSEWDMYINKVKTQILHFYNPPISKSLHDFVLRDQSLRVNT